jgi:hypothetical protein
MKLKVLKLLDIIYLLKTISIQKKIKTIVSNAFTPFVVPQLNAILYDD